MDYPKSVPNVGLVNGRFVDENVSTGQPGSLIPAVWGDSVTLEILNVIKDGGLVPNEADTAQLSKAIKVLVTEGSVAFASQEVAEAGTDLTKAMSAKRVFQAIAKVVTQANETVFGWLKIANQAIVNAGVDDTAAVTAKKLALTARNQSFAYFNSSGSGTAYSITPVPAAVAPTAGQRFCVKFHVASGANPIVGISSLAAQNLKQYDASGVKIAAVISANKVSDIVYDGTDFVVMDPLPISVSAATESVVGIARLATYSEVVSGTDDGTIVTPKKLLIGFNRSFGSNGYIAFPPWLGGWVVQWGQALAGVSVISFPLAFPNSALTINLTANDSSTSASANAHCFGSLSTSAFTRGASFTNAMRWIAIGY